MSEGLQIQNVEIDELERMWGDLLPVEGKKAYRETIQRFHDAADEAIGKNMKLAAERDGWVKDFNTLAKEVDGLRGAIIAHCSDEGCYDKQVAGERACNNCILHAALKDKPTEEADAIAVHCADCGDPIEPESPEETKCEDCKQQEILESEMEGAG